MRSAFTWRANTRRSARMRSRTERFGFRTNAWSKRRWGVCVLFDVSRWFSYLMALPFETRNPREREFFYRSSDRSYESLDVPSHRISMTNSSLPICFLEEFFPVWNELQSSLTIGCRSCSGSTGATGSHRCLRGTGARMRFIRRFVAAHRLKPNRSILFEFERSFPSHRFGIRLFHTARRCGHFRLRFLRSTYENRSSRWLASERSEPVFELDRMLLALLFFAGAPGDFDVDLLGAAWLFDLVD